MRHAWAEPGKCEVVSKHGTHPHLLGRHLASGVFGGCQEVTGLGGEERFLSEAYTTWRFTGEIGDVLVFGCQHELLDSQGFNACWWRVKVLMTGGVTPSGVCLCQRSCSSKTVWSPAVTLRLSMFRGNRNVKGKLKPFSVTMFFLVLSLDLALRLNQRNEGEITLGSVFTLRREMGLSLDLSKASPLKKQRTCHTSPLPRHSRDKGDQG